MQRLFGVGRSTEFDSEIVEIEAAGRGQRIHLQETALETVTTYIVDRASLAILRTNDEKLHHRWNVRPNPYQNAQEFKRKIVRHLLIDGEVGVVQEGTDNYLHIVDSFTKEKKSLNEEIYTDILVGDEELADRTTDDFYLFTYKNDKVSKWTEQLDNDYVDLFNRLVEIQKLQAQIRIYPRFDTMGSKAKENQKKFKRFLEDFKEAVNSQQVVIAPTQKDFDISENKSAFKGFNVDEVSKMEKIYLANVCQLYGISPSLFEGDLADVKEHRDDFVRFVHSVMQIFATEINSKYFKDGDADFEEDQVRVVMFYLEYNSALEAARDIEKALGTGVYTINNILEMQGRELSDDEYANRRFLTRNIGAIEEVDLKGGGDTEREVVKKDEEN